MTLRNLQIGAFAACAGIGLCSFTLSAQDAPPAAPAEAKPAAANEPALATFEGGAITRAAYEKAAAIKVLPVRIELAKSDEAKRKLLEDMIDFEVLLLEAQRRNYAEHPAVLHAMREESVKVLLEGPLAVAPDSLPEAEVKAAYQARIQELERPELRRARHVVLASEEEAKALIAEARKPRANATDLIARAAREKSLDQDTKRQSGELGAFTATGVRVGREDIVHPALAKAAFAIRKNGEVAPKPIKLTEGFSVLVLVDRTEATKTSASEALVAFRETLAQERSAAATEALLAELKQARPTQTFPERVNGITLDPPPTADMPQGFAAAPRDPTIPPVIQEPDGF